MGLVLEASHAGIQRAGDHLRLPVHAGELLFTGDSVLAEKGSVRFLACRGSAPGGIYQVAGGSVTLAQAGPEAGWPTAVGEVPGGFCLLPELERHPALPSADITLEPAQAVSSRSRSVDDTVPASIRTQLEALEKALRPAGDLAVHVARGVFLARSGQAKQAAAEYAEIDARWTEQEWARLLVHRAKAEANDQAGQGRLYALLVGVSEYDSSKDPRQRIPKLRFAHKDALLFNSYLQTRRGGEHRPSRDLITLVNERATFGTVRPTLNWFLQRAGRNDSVLVYLAAHGLSYGEDGFVMLYDSNLQAPYGNAVAMGDLRNVLAALAKRVSRVLVFVDACHANRIGQIREFNRVNTQIQEVVREVRTGEILALYAGNNNEPSFEHTRFGGGHGAFTYFLLRALNIRRGDPDYPEVDVDGDGKVTPSELVDYVYLTVWKSTGRKQRPQADRRISDQAWGTPTDIPGLEMPCCNPLEPQRAMAPPLSATASREPEAAGPGAEDATRGVDLKALERLTALENEGQKLLDKYLEGEEIPQTKEDFERGGQIYAEAKHLAGDSAFLEARETFFRGRALIFDKRYAEAGDYLQRSIRIDPGSPHALNALGIALLEQARYSEAESAFGDAIRRAPYWAYPRHNLALVHLQRGQYARAVTVYQEAMSIAPWYSYLPYNLGLIYQKTNREREAEQAFVASVRLAPWRAAPLVALGLLYASAGRRAPALSYYLRAYDALAAHPDPPNLLALRHNHALLLARSDDGLAQARKLWELNISEANYLPSRFALAETCSEAARRSDSKDPAQARSLMQAAIGQYEAILEQLPQHAGARLALASSLEETGEVDRAAAQLDEARRLHPSNPLVAERFADLAARRNQRDEARQAYERALAATQDPLVHKRIRAKLAKL